MVPGSDRIFLSFGSSFRDMRLRLFHLFVPVCRFLSTVDESGGV